MPPQDHSPFQSLGGLHTHPSTGRPERGQQPYCHHGHCDGAEHGDTGAPEQRLAGEVVEHGGGDRASEHGADRELCGGAREDAGEDAARVGAEGGADTDLAPSPR